MPPLNICLPKALGLKVHHGSRLHVSPLIGQDCVGCTTAWDSAPQTSVMVPLHHVCEFYTVTILIVYRIFVIYSRICMSFIKIFTKLENVKTGNVKTLKNFIGTKCPQKSMHPICFEIKYAFKLWAKGWRFSLVLMTVVGEKVTL